MYYTELEASGFMTQYRQKHGRENTWTNNALKMEGGDLSAGWRCLLDTVDFYSNEEHNNLVLRESSRVASHSHTVGVVVLQGHPHPLLGHQSHDACEVIALENTA